MPDAAPRPPPAVPLHQKIPDVFARSLLTSVNQGMSSGLIAADSSPPSTPRPFLYLSSAVCETLHPHLDTSQIIRPRLDAGRRNDTTQNTTPFFFQTMPQQTGQYGDGYGVGWKLFMLLNMMVTICLIGNMQVRPDIGRIRVYFNRSASYVPISTETRKQKFNKRSHRVAAKTKRRKRTN